MSKEVLVTFTIIYYKHKWMYFQAPKDFNHIFFKTS